MVQTRLQKSQKKVDNNDKVRKQQQETDRARLAKKRDKNKEEEEENEIKRSTRKDAKCKILKNYYIDEETLELELKDERTIKP